MKSYQILSTINLNTLDNEIFILPLETKQAIENLSTIKNNSQGYWTREKRELIQMPKQVEVSSMEFKYIVVETDTHPLMFIFSKNVNHDCFFEIIPYLIDNEFHPVLSAGFTDLKTCYGRSETLRISSREEDTKLLSVIKY